MTFKEKFQSKSKSIIRQMIEAIMSPFFDKDELFSWKKGMTAVVTFVFAYACIGFLNKHNFDPLPDAYVWLIVLIFTAYFGKDVPQGFIDLGSKYFDSKIQKQKQLQDGVNGDPK